MISYFNRLINKSKGGVFIIAEACDNHMGSLEIAKSLVDAAVYAGADAVKFQHHLPHEEMLEDVPKSKNFDEPLFDFLLKNSLNINDHVKLKKYCDQKKILYLCTPFSYMASKEISSLVPFFKIGSGEFQDYWFIDRLSKLKKPILFSSGMCSESELFENVDYFKSINIDFAILNCLSEYPPIYEDMNLGFIKTLTERLDGTVIGHSDHSNEIFTSIIACSFGAKIIEKHLTLSKFIKGPDSDVSIDPDQFKQLVNNLREINKTLGYRKKINRKEKIIRSWAYRSVVTTRDLKKNTKLSHLDIKTKRPGIGINSKSYKLIINKKLKKNVKANKLLALSDFE